MIIKTFKQKKKKRLTSVEVLKIRLLIDNSGYFIYIKTYYNDE